MSLQIHVVSASNLQNLETFGKSDPYVSISFQGGKKKTTTKDDTLDPEWDEKLEWEVSTAKPPGPDECIDIEIKDYEKLGRNRLLGKGTIPMRNLLQAATAQDYDMSLLDGHNNPTVGSLKMIITYKSPLGNQQPNRTRQVVPQPIRTSQVPPLAQSQVSKPNVITPVALAGSSQAATPNSDTSESARKTAGGKQGGMATTGNMAVASAGVGGDMVDGIDVSDMGSGGGMPHFNIQQSQRARDSLSSAPTKFQIRVRVVEGRQLLGNNLKPVCSVRLGDETKQTRVHKGTASPWFDQIFFFQLEENPKELMEKFLQFKVCNSSSLRSGTLIGAFECEIGMVYDQPEHTILNRWLVLANPEEPTPTVQGYLKVSVAVLGPGDVSPDMTARRSDADDVEANLLWSAGVHLQPASFTLAVYCAQNLPRMDAGTMQTLKEVFGIGKASKELVDPYLVANYAGKEVQTKILYTNENPEFRQNLHLGFLFPSMCNSINITMKDWDRVGNDDTIGTASIPVSAISAPGEDGFLPCFGPSWVNVYGGRRDWELIDKDKSDQMNEGFSEGCAYRGRVLVSLHTNVGNYPAAPTTNLDDDAYFRVRRYRSTRRFQLLCQLSSCTLLSAAGKPLEIEVSMGNFGNKLENTIMPSPSSTHPSNPVFDGCKYYFLPWGESCPFVSVPCEWEDVTHRLYCMNAITKIATELEKDLDMLESRMRARRDKNDEDNDMAEFIQGIVSRLIDGCCAPLPEVDPVRHIETSLDKHLRDRRRKELDRLAEDTRSLSDHLKNVDHVVMELKSTLDALKNLSIEPQASMPDIFLWLMSGAKRLGYTRIPASSVLFSHNEAAKGPLSGVFSTFTLVNPDDETGFDLGGVVRCALWFGREDEADHWWQYQQSHLSLTVYAESYENQIISAPGSGKWTQKGILMTRPAFSDADGRLALEKEAFTAPYGWNFAGDWIVEPDPSVQYEADAGHSQFNEEVFEVQVRIPGGTWIQAPANPWQDVRGDPATTRDEITCPQGWAWADVWTYDLQRAVDGEGWEYTVQSGFMSWSPQEKLYHLVRRRRWVRERRLRERIIKDTQSSEGWEYAPLFNLQFHAIERKIDLVRRRRWRRPMTATREGLPPTPTLSVKSGDGKDAITQYACPRMYVVSKSQHVYQLRAHLYQARDLEAGDKSGFSDPYAVVCFYNATQQTEKLSATLCPTWDQTLIFDNVKLADALPHTNQNPPQAVVEIYDWDARGAPEFLGRVFCSPTVIDPSQGYEPVGLKWFKLEKGNIRQGELLASFELFLKDNAELPEMPPTRGSNYMVPFKVRPVLQKTRVEILCWGLRNMSTYELQSVSRPTIEFECGGQRIVSAKMTNLQANPNFDKPHLTFDVDLPKENLFMPPLTLRIVDHRAFGNKPVVGTGVVTDLHHVTVEPKKARQKLLLASMTSLNLLKTGNDKKVPDVNSATAAQFPHRPILNDLQSSREYKEGLNYSMPGTVDVDIDWWSKFYASNNELDRCGSYLKKGYQIMKVCSGNLETEPEYEGFKDLVETLPLFRGRGDQQQEVGQFKGAFKIYPLNSESGGEPPMVLDGFPSPAPQEVVARVYIIQGKDIAPKDAGGSSDPYVMVKLGKNSKSSVKEFRPNTLNPVFGHVFELSGSLPLHKDLVIQVWDHDYGTSNDLIGETTIDLENRFLSRHRATCGLPVQYHVSGPNAWRDVELPTEILNKEANMRHLNVPVWHTDPLSLTLAGTNYSIKQFESEDCILPPTLGDSRERLALHVLHKALSLVPEHVETRTLQHPARPGMEQGKLQLWVDIFPSTTTLPQQVSIIPRNPTKYVLRVVVYNVYDTPLQESNIAGEQMSDVYVKTWMQGTNDVQKTDIHYRCMDGDANFNWRMVYNFEMLEAEQMMVTEKKEKAWSVHATQERRPPQLTLQLWDNDLISRDDYLSEMTLDLCSLPKPARSKASVTMDQMPNLSHHDGNTAVVNIDDKTDIINLFEAKRVYGFYPFIHTREGIEGDVEIAGKIEMELEVLTEEESKTRPAGHGRDEPNMNPKLKDPDRPATSFLWFTSPFKSFRHIIWKNYKWYCITLVVLVFLFLFLFLFLYSLPGATMDYLIGVD